MLVVSETAKYIYTAKIPDSVTAKIEPSVDKLAAVLGTAQSAVGQNKDSQEAFKIAVLSDSHNDSQYLEKALAKAKDQNVDSVIFLGDYTDWGDTPSLEKAKSIMAASGLTYYSLPGDHDLGQTRDESNFKNIFGGTYGTIEMEGSKLMFFDNSKNHTTLEQSVMDWFKKEITDTNYLFLSQPLMTERMGRVMGIIDGTKDAAVFEQNLQLLTTVRSSSVKVIMAGDLHQFSKFQDPEKSDLVHYTVGAVLKSQGLEKLNLQAPRFEVLTVNNDSSYSIDDVTID